MSVAIHLFSTPSNAGEGDGTRSESSRQSPGAKVIQFIPNNPHEPTGHHRGQPHSTRMVRIAKLDTSWRIVPANSSFVYQIQNRPAASRACRGRRQIRPDGGSKASGAANVSPDMAPTAMTSDGVTPAPLTRRARVLLLPAARRETPSCQRYQGRCGRRQRAAHPNHGARISADRADIGEGRRSANPGHVLEATIAEVTLNDGVEVGLHRYFLSAVGRRFLARPATGAATAASWPPGHTPPTVFRLR